MQFLGDGTDCHPCLHFQCKAIGNNVGTVERPFHEGCTDYRPCLHFQCKTIGNNVGTVERPFHEECTDYHPCLCYQVFGVVLVGFPLHRIVTDV
jgi:hypothetical protein